MKTNTQEKMLDSIFRAQVITEIMTGTEARTRKEEHEKRAEVYKDRTREYALRLITKEMGQKAADEIVHRTPNINITKKVVDKKARVYKSRPERKAEIEANQESIDCVADYLRLDNFCKSLNRMVELHQNMLVGVIPHMVYESERSREEWEIGLKTYNPSRFDVIEDMNNPREPLMVILSYVDTGGGVLRDYRAGDSVTSKIAEGEAARAKGLASDPNNKRFVWWSKGYHMTTDGNGIILYGPGLTPEGAVNPFGALPFVSFAKNQGEGFWSDGGEGMADNAILINVLLGDLNFSAKYQATGLGYIIAKEPPTNEYIGPNRFLKISQQEGEPTPQVGFASPNPQLADSMAIIEQQLAMFLTSEGLEANAIAGKLEAGNQTSGIQDVISKSEPITAIEDEQQLYKDKEPLIIELVSVEVATFIKANKYLCEDLTAIKWSDKMDYTLIFKPAQVLLTEKERLDLIITKQQTGLFTDLELLKDLHPDMAEPELESKLASLKEVKAAKVADAKIGFKAEPEIEKENEPEV